MSHGVIAAVVFIVTAACGALFVSRAIVLAPKLGLVDLPEPRRAHDRVMPRAGGLAIFLAFALGLGLSFSLDFQRFSTETARLVLMLAGGITLVGVMVFDDAVGLAPWPKLAWQIVAASIVALPRLRGPDHGIVIERFNPPFTDQVALPYLVAIIVTVVWIVGFANAINFADGLDGLAASITLVACSVLFIHTFFWPRNDPQFTISLLPLTLGAAVIGFLPFNWHPARIIMGDAGAQFLGYALAIISIIGGAKIAAALLALGVPALDLAWVITYRVVQGRSPMMADRGHLHHRLIDAGWGHQRVVLFVAGLSAFFGFGALWLPSREAKLVAMALVGFVLLATIAFLAYTDRRRRRPQQHPGAAK